MGEPERYARRVSGPLLDRIDLQVRMPRVDPLDLIAPRPSEGSATVRARIATVRGRTAARNGSVPNARLPGDALLDACALTSDAATRLRDVAMSEGLSARSLHRVLRVARTVADLRDAPGVDDQDVTAALSLRDDVLVRRLAA